MVMPCCCRRRVVCWQVTLSQAVYTVPDPRFYELLRLELVFCGVTALRCRVLGYHKVKAKAADKLVPEAPGVRPR